MMLPNGRQRRYHRLIRVICSVETVRQQLRI
jgi:hypothetical protein